MIVVVSPFERPTIRPTSTAIILCTGDVADAEPAGGIRARALLPEEHIGLEGCEIAAFLSDEPAQVDSAAFHRHGVQPDR